MDFSMIGVHVGSDYSLFKESFDKGVRTFQIFLSSPITWGSPKYGFFLNMFQYMNKKLSREERLNIVIHLPFTFSLVKPVHRENLFKYCKNIYENLSYVVRADNNIKIYLVSHCGAKLPLSLEENLAELSKIGEDFFDLSKNQIVFTYENDSGSKNNSKIGSIENLLLLQERYKHINITFDTEHAFANGTSLEDELYIDKILYYSSLVHLNSIPYQVTLGGHLDRHSNTYIKDGQQVNALVNIAKKCLKENIPMILERDSSMVLKDRDWLIEEIVNGQWD